ncbi:MAG: toll/interleukin-1 receptor domain-containing protein [Candidatus Thiodiazotropha sp.]
MANQQQLRLLQSSVNEWNEWREESRYRVTADLDSADLRHMDLKKANLGGAHLSDANLRGSDLCGANLTHANLCRANLRNAKLDDVNLSTANLLHANLTGARIIGANLKDADLTGANLREVNLTGAVLRNTCLIDSYLNSANLTRADFSGAIFSGTTLADSLFTDSVSLDKARHHGPTAVDNLTLSNNPNLSGQFLRGCGMRDWEIEARKLYQEGLTRDDATDIIYQIDKLLFGQSISIHPIFLSYSHADSIIVDGIYNRLQKRGIRCWQDKRDLIAGKIEVQISEAMIKLKPVVIIVLSKNSVKSDWVEWEAEKARQLEKDLKRDVLCPITLDDAWKYCDWPGPLRNQIMKYNVLDFSSGDQFEKLILGITKHYC